VPLTANQIRFGFGSALSEEEPARLFDKWAIPSPARPLFEAARANFSLYSQAKVDTGNQTRGLLLMISGAEDHAVPDISTRSTLKRIRQRAVSSSTDAYVRPRRTAGRFWIWRS
jgi:hypothetical protein